MSGQKSQVKIMQMYRWASFILLSLSTAASAGVLRVDLDSANASKFTGIGTAAAIYTDPVQVQNTQTGELDDFELVVNISGSGAITLNSTGLGIVDSAVNDGETIDFEFTLTPSAGTMSGLASFQFTEIGHGVADSNLFAANPHFVAVTDNVRVEILDNGLAGPTAIDRLQGNRLSVRASGAPFAAGSVDGISSITFDATSIPEPTSFLLCSFCIGGLTIRRRRRAVAAK